MSEGVERDFYDLVVVGAGPAGMAGAALAARAGLTTLVVDENPSEGGQIYRAVSAAPNVERRVLGEDYWRGETLVRELRESGAEILRGATVWSLDRDRVVGISKGGQARLVKAKRVIIATGALERPFPIPGWTLPGVMTAGAAQTVLKSSGLVPDGRVIIAGQGPLLWLLAAQILRAGGAIDRILDTTPRENYWRAAPHALGFLTSPYARKGLAMMREVKRKVRVVRGVTRLEAGGTEKLESVTYVAGGAAETVPADILLLHQGVVPHVNLAVAVGVEHRWDDVQLCWRPVLGPSGETNIEGIAVTGDGAGIGGAEVAAERGRIAALAAVAALRPEAAKSLPAMEAVRSALARRERGRAFLDILFQPAKAFRLPQDDTIACRCEEVTAGEVREAVRIGATGPNQLKAYRRCGMGPCQGRLCGLTVTELIADERGVTPQEAGYYRLRSPVKPITLAEIASMPQDEAALKAVVRG